MRGHGVVVGVNGDGGAGRLGPQPQTSLCPPATITSGSGFSENLLSWALVAVATEGPSKQSLAPRPNN
ncbi:hypothetical protein SLA2020_399670 [Shorea laevis]